MSVRHDHAPSLPRCPYRPPPIMPPPRPGVPCPQACMVCAIPPPCPGGLCAACNQEGRPAKHHRAGRALCVCIAEGPVCVHWLVQLGCCVVVLTWGMVRCCVVWQGVTWCSSVLCEQAHGMSCVPLWCSSVLCEQAHGMSCVPL